MATLSQVLCKEACDELGLDASAEWLEFGFKKFMWRIGLKWEDGNLFFDRQWNTFAKAGKLAVGDKLMLMRDKHWQIFEVAVFEKECGTLPNNFGIFLETQYNFFSNSIRHSILFCVSHTFSQDIMKVEAS